MLSDAELNALATQVDDQLKFLRAGPAVTHRGVNDTSVPDAPTQRSVVEKITGQSFDSFWEKYRRSLWKDLCLPGGLMFEQWRKYRDVESKSAVRVSYAWLAMMGIPTASLAPAAVAATVFLLNVLVKVGVDAVCEGCAQGTAGKEPPARG